MEGVKLLVFCTEQAFWGKGAKRNVGSEKAKGKFTIKEMMSNSRYFDEHLRWLRQNQLSQMGKGRSEVWGLKWGTRRNNEET